MKLVLDTIRQYLPPTLFSKQYDCSLFHLFYLSDVEGPQNDRLKNAIKWNRTTDLQGGAGQNLELGLVNEFLNRDFKGKPAICEFWF